MINRIKNYYRNNGGISVLKKMIFTIINPIYLNLKFIFTEFSYDTITVSASVPVLNYRFAKLNNQNWGDDVSYTLAELISNKKVIPTEYSIKNKFFNKENYLIIGSIITWMVKENSIIWGSGVISPDKELLHKPLKVIAVRGPLSRKYLIDRNIDCPEIYGDPALLFPMYYFPSIIKKYKIGIIPHRNHQNNKDFLRIRNNYDIKFIDIIHYGHWQNFIDQILECDLILSSSLHGIIISDAYNVPNVWISPTKLDYNERFKYLDYFLSVNKNIETPLVIDSNTKINDIEKHHLEWTPISINLDILKNSCPF